jgi:hypothetical protein
VAQLHDIWWWRWINVDEMSSLNQYQDGQCTYDVTVRHVRAALVAVEKQLLHILSACVYSFMYPACNAHSPYCNLWLVRLCLIYPHYLINATILRKKNYWTQNVCFDFLCYVCMKHFSF